MTIKNATLEGFVSLIDSFHEWISRYIRLMASAHWIWNSTDWPRFTWDAARLAAPLLDAHVAFERLLAKGDALSADQRSGAERDVWSSEAIATAAIEGEDLPLASVRSSIARRLGLPADAVPSPRAVEGLLDVMENAAHRWQEPLSDERLLRWQAALFPSGGTALRRIAVGRYRTHPDAMQIVSGPVGHERVHYEAPPSADVAREMAAFIEWFERTRDGSVDAIVRAGLAHLWFESIHPFEDGNGRVGRAIVDLALAQGVRRATRLHGIANEMRRQRDAYYDALNAAQRGAGDATAWLAWFVGTFADACRASAALVDEALGRARFWSEHRHVTLNERQRKALNRMLDAGPGRFDGGLTARKYVGMTGASRAAAGRDIAELVAAGLLVAGAASGRSTYYDLAIPGWEWRPR